MVCTSGCRRRLSGAFNPQLETHKRYVHVVRLPLASIGELRGVIYRAKGLSGEAPKTYVHFFDGRLPRLATNTAGTRLYIVGGRYRVTRRGIQG